MSDDAAHIVIPGPHIEVRDDSLTAKQQRRMEEARDHAIMAGTLAESPAWEWFKDRCSSKARTYTGMLADASRELSPREEDRLRGRIEAYTHMPLLIEQAQHRFDQLQKQQAKKGTTR